MLVHQGEGSGTPSEPHHTPFPEFESSHPTTSSIPLPSIPTAPIPPVTQSVTTPIIQYEGEACPTKSGFIADQDRATIVKSSTLPHDSAPRVTSPADDKGSMQHNISELMALCTSLQRQYSELQAEFQAQEEEIVNLKDKVKVLEDREGVAAKQSGDDALIKGMKIEAKFAEVWKHVEDFIPIGSKEETKRLKRKWLNLEKEQVKKQKSSEEAPEIKTSTKEFTEEKMKEMV
nr:hypothetical protein [Tanacetum cinerariifolium]